MITAHELRERFYYYKSTGMWKARTGRTRVVGSLHSSGYIHIKINGRIYKAHRLAWLYVTGSFPIEDVEHKNLVKSDNRWKNLRLVASDSLNQANVRRRVDNTSGFKSVHFRSDTKKWRANIQVMGKRRSLGCFSTPRAAHLAYMKAAKQHFGEFARAS